jgi:adhesin HecA-like repeat protein
LRLRKLASVINVAAAMPTFTPPQATRRPRTLRPPLLRAVPALLLAAAAWPAHAVDYVWLGQTGDGLWFSNAVVQNNVVLQNWSPAGPPLNRSETRVFIDNDPSRASRVQVVPFSVVSTPFCTNPVSCGSWATVGQLTIDAGDAVVVGGSVPFADGMRYNNGHIGIELSDTGSGATLVNNGLLRLSSDGKYAKLAVRGVATLQGSGETVLDNGYDTTDARASFNRNQIVFGANGYGDRLVIAAGHTVRGRGNLGYNGTLAIDNHGLVQAEAGGTLALNGLYGIPPPRTHAIVNTGTLRATGAARLTISGSVDNTGGLIEAADASFVDLSSGVSHGTLRTAGSGVIRSVGASTSYPTVRGQVLLQGHLHAPDGKKLGLGQQLTNQGTLRVGGDTPGIAYSGNQGGELHFMEDTLIDGTGRIELSDSATRINRFTGYAGGIGRTPVLTIGAGQTLTGSGRLGGTSSGVRNLDFINQGTVRAEALNPLILAPAASFLNQGTVQVSTQLQTEGLDSFVSTGRVQVDAGGSVLGSMTQTAGWMTVDGTAETVLLQGGRLDGTGSIGQLIQTGGVFSPGHSPGSATLGQYSLAGGGVLRLEIDGDDFAQADHLQVTGDADLAGGTVELDFSGYSGSGQASFSGLLQVDGSLSPQAALVVTGLGQGARYQAQWSGGTLSLQIQSAVPEPGSWVLMLLGLAGLAGWAVPRPLARRRATGQAG